MALLGAGELGLLSAESAFGFRDLHAFPGSGADQVGFELGNHGEDIEQEPSDGVVGVVDRSADAEFHVLGGEFVNGTLLKTGDAPVRTRVFSARTAAEIRTMLQMAAGPGGTGPKAQTLGYSVGGKSGTAHKQVGKSYASNKYRSWFVGLAPIDKPRIIVAVMVDEPTAGKYFGGDVAAPVFSATVQQTLRMMGVQPDMNVKPQIVVDAVEESF